jgi:hypothetical protein
MSWMLAATVAIAAPAGVADTTGVVFRLSTRSSRLLPTAQPARAAAIDEFRIGNWPAAVRDERMMLLAPRERTPAWFGRVRLIHAIAASLIPPFVTPAKAGVT